MILIQQPQRQNSRFVSDVFLSDDMDSIVLDLGDTSLLNELRHLHELYQSSNELAASIKLQQPSFNLKQAETT